MVPVGQELLTAAAVLDPDDAGFGELDALRVGKTESTAALDGGARQDCVRNFIWDCTEAAVSSGCVWAHPWATVLVGRGQILQAQYRLGHADAYTTLRIYSLAQPLQDLDAADTLDELYRT